MLGSDDLNCHLLMLCHNSLINNLIIVSMHDMFAGSQTKQKQRCASRF